jgi:site-specific recombinase XerD
MPADQTMNRYLKAVAKLEKVAIHKDISHKTGRHTFATFYLSKTKDMNALMEEMGHANISETLKYAHVLNADKKDNIRCFDVFMADPDTTEGCEA